MKNLQLVLGGDNISGTDISLCWSEEEGIHYLFLGLALIQRLPAKRDHVLHKLAVAQLVNAGVHLRLLARELHHAPVVMKRWGAAVQAGDLDGIAAAFSGQGAEQKITPDREAFIRGQYLVLRELYPDFRQRIASAVKKKFGVTVSGESLRQIFRLEDGTSCKQKKPARPVVEEKVDAISSTGEKWDGPFSIQDVHDTEKPLALPSKECLDIQTTDNASDDPKSCSCEPCPSVPSVLQNNTSTCGLKPVSGIDFPKERNLSYASPSAPTVPIRTGLPLSGFDPRGEAFMIHHAGQVLFSPFLDTLATNGGEDWPMHKQWLAQILQGAVNIEQSKTLCATSLSLLCGNCGAKHDAQRRSLKRQALDPDAALELYRRGAWFLLDGPDVGEEFYYDVHSEKYTGSQPILKGWCGSQRGVNKVLHMDFIHTRHGDPCFAFHADNYYDLRERIFMVLERFTRLCSGPKRPRTWIIDRGIFRFDIFDAFREDGNHLITWELGYAHDGWDKSAPAALFRRFRERNEPGTVLCWKFACQERPWLKNPSVRRIIVRVTTPKGTESEVSVLCTHPTMRLEEAVTLIFNRWVQENDFWYLIVYMGIGYITSYASESYADIADTLKDRPMDCPKYREMKNHCAQQERKLGKQLLAQRRRDQQIKQNEDTAKKLKRQWAKINEKLPLLFKQVNDGDLENNVMDRIDRLMERARKNHAERARLQRSLPALHRARGKTEEMIRSLENEIAQLRHVMDQELRNDSRLHLLIAHNYRRLDTRAKAVMDALRITARNIFYRLLEVFRPIYRNYRDDHVILRELTRSPGILRHPPGSAFIEIELRPQATYTKGVRQRVERFLELMTTYINKHFNGEASPIRITLAENAAIPVI